MSEVLPLMPTPKDYLRLAEHYRSAKPPGTGLPATLRRSNASQILASRDGRSARRRRQLETCAASQAPSCRRVAQHDAKHGGVVAGYSQEYEEVPDRVLKSQLPR